MAAADYAEGRSQEPPPELTKAWRCRNWGTLPRAGGLEEQPAHTMLLMEVALNAHDAFKVRMRVSPKDWLTEYTRLAIFCTRVDAWRADRG